MNVNKLIVDTLTPIIPNDTPDTPNIKHLKYSGLSNTYIVFNYTDDRGELFADDTPQEDIASLQIHLFCPGDYNYLNLKKQIRSKLFAAGFTYPEIPFDTYEKDTDKKHIVFECEIDGNSEVEE